MGTDNYTLGINTSHDRAACLAKNGVPLVAIAEERLDRRKHSVEADVEGNLLSKLPTRAVRYCLDEAGITINDVSRILVSSSVIYHPERPLRNLELFDILPQLQELKDPSKLEIVNHHLAHAASAFYSSPFEEAAVIVVDGGGNIVGDRPKKLLWMPQVEHTTLYHANGNEIRELKKVNAKKKSLNSLGALYNLITMFVGFGQFNEGKTMGLAPYGRPVFTERFEQAVKFLGDGVYDIEAAFQPFDWRGRMIPPAFIKMFGSPRPAGSDLRQVDRDLAYAVQAVLERTLIKIATDLHQMTGSRNLCIAGGVGLNSVANKKILDDTPFENIFVVPCAADDGCALGGAFLGWHGADGAAKNYVMKTASMGRSYSQAEIVEAVERESERVTFHKSENVAQETAKLIASGNVVGWLQGGGEIGPRALGFRSILCDPRYPEMKDVVNEKVKHREGFRPFAPVIMQERASEYFELECPSPFMLLIAQVKKGDQIPAVTHIDNTARVQTVNAEDNGIFYELVKEFGNLTGVPVILNTSFNIAGDPIVETPGDALECFLKTQIDYLVMGDVIVAKKDRKTAHAIAELHRRLRESEQKVQAYESELERIRQSRGWRLLESINKVRHLIFRRQREMDFM